MKNKTCLKGSITIYLLLTFTVLLSFILVIVEGSREHTMKHKIECAMDLSIYSVFAEYNRELLNQYDLFFIDASYGKSGASAENIGNHLKQYMNENFEVKTPFGLVKDLMGLTADNVEINDYSLATDESGMILKRQAVSYIKDLYGADIVKDLKDQIKECEDHGLLTTDIDAKQKENQRIIDSIEIPKKKTSDGKWVEQKLDNPADPVNKSRGILSLILKNDYELSQTNVNLNNYVSHRSLNTGAGLQGRKAISKADELIFQEYIIKKSGCYTEPKKDSELTYQLEYILKGKSSDLDNLKAVVNQLLFMRQASNAMYLFNDVQKTKEVELIATAIALLLEVPDLAQYLKESILYAWVYAESVYDLRVLLAGGRVPLTKSSSTWHYSLGEMFFFAADKNVSVTGKEEGMSYVDYLRLLLSFETEKNKTFRFMDIVEMDIRKKPGNKYFQVDVCVDDLTANVFVNSSYGRNFSIKRTYFYY